VRKLSEASISLALTVNCCHLIVYTMTDSDFSHLLDSYLEPDADPHPMAGNVQVMWERNSLNMGSRHIWEKHRVTEEEVEQVILEVPPYVDIKDHPVLVNRTMFWGATRLDRWIFVVCEEWQESGLMYLRPLTAFEPEEGVDYWESFQ
tara:strand:+ start:77 stop:520 length:444 start_codon:yes stop_codon:yes gene_type:complete